VDYSKR
jgi:hypothetical protein